MFVGKPNDAFDMSRLVLKDYSVRDFQYYSYDARTPDQRGGRIELQVQDTSRYFLPAQAFIEVEGALTRADNHKPHAVNSQIGFVNNGIMVLFRSAIYMIEGKAIETIHDNVDVATNVSMRRPQNNARNAAVDVENLSFLNPDFNMEFAAHKSMLDDHGRFSCVIPLSHIFGFSRDVRKVIFGAKHTVVLVRKSNDNDAIWRAAVVPDDEVTLTKLSLWMPVMSPSISEEQNLLSFMDTGGKSLLSWLTTTTDVFESNVANLFTLHISS